MLPPYLHPPCQALLHARLHPLDSFGNLQMRLSSAGCRCPSRAAPLSAPPLPGCPPCPPASIGFFRASASEFCRVQVPFTCCPTICTPPPARLLQVCLNAAAASDASGVETRRWSFHMRPSLPYLTQAQQQFLSTHPEGAQSLVPVGKHAGGGTRPVPRQALI